MLYTRKGDGGMTKALDSKSRFSKHSPRAEALGSLDELNSHIGLCKVTASGVQEGGVKIGREMLATPDILHEVQKNLFIVQAEVAGATDKKIRKAKVTRLEKIIDTIEKELPPITGFTIAGGSEVSALLDVTRTIVRRTERRVIAVHEYGERTISTHSRAYMNRLSSLFFALARLSNHRSGITEESPDYT